MEDMKLGRQSFLHEAVRRTLERNATLSSDTIGMESKSSVVPFPENERSAFALPRSLAALSAPFLPLCLLFLLAIQWSAVLRWISFGAFEGWTWWSRLLVIALGIAAIIGEPFLVGMFEYRAAKRIAAGRKTPEDFEASELVAVEPADTFDRMKFSLADDIATLHHDLEHRRILIDGLSCRYLLHGDDVQFVESKKQIGATAVRLDVRIGGTMLSIVISTREDHDETDRDGLVTRICNTLRLAPNTNKQS